MQNITGNPVKNLKIFSLRIRELFFLGISQIKLFFLKYNKIIYENHSIF